ncbi:MAG: type II secretion system F family protein [Rhodospirillales bacterium]|nr:type II secretion system F family protein [Rhodospirillales bacterium]
MSGITIPVAVALIAILTLLAGLVTFQLTRQEHRLESRIRALHMRPETSFGPIRRERESLRQTAMTAVSRIGQWVLSRRMLSKNLLEDFEKRLAAGGMRGAAAMRLFIGGKIVLLLGLPLIAWFASIELGMSSIMHLWLPLGGGVIGLLAPDFIVNRIRERHAKRLAVELPDALDMMVICAQAGLGLGPMILRVAEELHSSHKGVASEFGQTADELQISTDAQAALTRLGERSGVDSVRRLATTLVQSAQYGTPLSGALRGLAAELRTELVTRYEARAAKLPVLLTIPMIMFVLPSLFLIVGGPAVMEVMRALKH